MKIARYAGFLVCSLIGYVIGNYLLSGAAAAYASVLISYHLYLVILIVISPQRARVSMPIGQTILTHSAFLAVLIGMPFLRHVIPFFGIIRLFVPALAPFEVKWLFSEDKAARKPTTGSVTAIRADPKSKKSETLSVDDLINAATADEHELFLAYMRQPRRVFSQPGRSVREEYGYWLADRSRRRAAAAAASAAAVSAAGSSGASNATGTGSQ
ncbi:MAG: hypothetical protein WAL75_21740 [Terracidiphilus sp.]